MLSHRKRAESSVEGPASPGEELLLGESMEVHDPDPGHLVHGDESSLEGVVEGFVLGVSDGKVADELEALAEIGVPKLVASGEGL